MIIESWSRKSVSFSQVLDYINRPSEKGRSPVFHNLDGESDKLEAVAAEFLSNYHGFHSRRKNGVVLFHEVLSFSPKDRDFLAQRPEILNELCRDYLKLRAPDALGYAKAHFDTRNPHIHCLISGNLIESSKSLRLSKAAFRNIQRTMEDRQRLMFPEIQHSFAFRNRSDKEAVKTPQLQKEAGRRLGGAKETLKGRLAQFVKLHIGQAASMSEFEAGLLKEGFSLYRRTGKLAGVVDAKGRRFRFSTLGVSITQALKGWDLFQERKGRLQLMEREREYKNISPLLHPSARD